MSPTNIRSSYDLIGRGNSMSCVMPELNCRLILDGSADTDLDLGRYTSRLSHGLTDQWVTLDPNGNIDCGKGSVSPSSVLRIHISEHIRACHRSRQDLDTLGSGVECFLVVEGAQGARAQKLVVRGSVEQIAEVAFFEAANGFNVVFGGLLLKRQLAVLGCGGEVAFARVKDLGGLLEKDGEVGGGGISRHGLGVLLRRILTLDVDFPCVSIVPSVLPGCRKRNEYIVNVNYAWQFLMKAYFEML